MTVYLAVELESTSLPTQLADADAALEFARLTQHYYVIVVEGTHSWVMALDGTLTALTLVTSPRRRYKPCHSATL